MIAITVRRYEDGDFGLVRRLEESGGHETYRSAVFIRQMGTVCRNTFLVAALDAEPVRYTVGALVQGVPGEAWVLRMGVREDQRRNGVGSILLNELLDVFQALSVHTVRLTVSPWNAPALGLYAKAGFVQESYHEAYFGKVEDRIVMVKVIP